MKGKAKLLEHEFGKPLRDVLIELHDKHGSQSKMAQAIGVSQGTVSLWMKHTKLRVVQEVKEVE